MITDSSFPLFTRSFSTELTSANQCQYQSMTSINQCQYQPITVSM